MICLLFLLHDLKDYLIFDSEENDGLGEPKSVTFKMKKNRYLEFDDGFK